MSGREKVAPLAPPRERPRGRSRNASRRNRRPRLLAPWPPAKTSLPQSAPVPSDACPCTFGASLYPRCPPFEFDGLSAHSTLLYAPRIHRALSGRVDKSQRVSYFQTQDRYLLPSLLPLLVLPEVQPGRISTTYAGRIHRRAFLGVPSWSSATGVGRNR
ncbi:hypothetical protein DAEQUDRAFT_725036 [Daedalea quercina L-15889]|uniref:Uncharacterized protein n=1 Tax=Daedalea quercina L-15889 TaxID=1314783 RepID=A0A165RKH7_9APHY|nr:hypothetical protein DAEQUDRAFT_725036 [Daedalea quercina L-15889]